MRREYKGFYIEVGPRQFGSGRARASYKAYHVVTGALGPCENTLRQIREAIDEIHKDASEYARYAGCAVHELVPKRGRWIYGRDKMSTKHTSKASFTPGPWEYGQIAGQPEFYVCRAPRSVNEQNVLKIAEVCLENEANARLIASAPDLLSALKGLLAEWHQSGIASEEWANSRHKATQTRRLNKAMAAIAKAEGGDK